MNEIEHIAEDLYEKVRNQFTSLTIADEEARLVEEPAKARFFNFEFGHDGTNYGNVSISIADNKNLKIFYSKSISDDLGGEAERAWYDFLKTIRLFSHQNMMGFDVHNITKPNLTKKDFKFLSTNNKEEDAVDADLKEAKMSRMFGTTKSSYQKMEGAKIIVRHSNKVDENVKGSRSRNIKALFIENANGERFKMPFNYLPGARAMARHVNNGGTPLDPLGKHIVEMIGEMRSLQSVVKRIRSTEGMDAGGADIVEAVRDRYQGLKETIKSIKGSRGYKSFSETFNPEEMIDESGVEIDEDGMRASLSRKSYDSKLDEMLPLIARTVATYGAKKLKDKITGEAAEAEHDYTTPLNALADPNTPIEVYAHPEQEADVKAYIDFAKSTKDASGDKMLAVVNKIVHDISNRSTDDSVSVGLSRLDLAQKSDKALAYKIATKYLQGRVKTVSQKKKARLQTTETTDFEKWTDMITEGTWAIPDSDEDVQELTALLSNPFPVGDDADNATGSLTELFADDELFDELFGLFQRDGSDADATQLVISYLEKWSDDPFVAQTLAAINSGRAEAEMNSDMENEPDMDMDPDMEEAAPLGQPKHDYFDPDIIKAGLKKMNKEKPADDEHDHHKKELPIEEDTIEEMINSGSSDDDIMESYPDLTQSQVKNYRKKYSDHPEEYDESMDRVLSLSGIIQ